MIKCSYTISEIFYSKSRAILVKTLTFDIIIWIMRKLQNICISITLCYKTSWNHGIVLRKYMILSERYIQATSFKYSFVATLNYITLNIKYFT